MAAWAWGLKSVNEIFSTKKWDSDFVNYIQHKTRLNMQTGLCWWAGVKPTRLRLVCHQEKEMASCMWGVHPHTNHSLLACNLCIRRGGKLTPTHCRLLFLLRDFCILRWSTCMQSDPQGTCHRGCISRDSADGRTFPLAFSRSSASRWLVLLAWRRPRGGFFARCHPSKGIHRVLTCYPRHVVHPKFESEYCRFAPDGKNGLGWHLRRNRLRCRTLVLQDQS